MPDLDAMDVDRKVVELSLGPRVLLVGKRNAAIVDVRLAPVAAAM